MDSQLNKHKYEVPVVLQRVISKQMGQLQNYSFDQQDLESLYSQIESSHSTIDLSILVDSLMDLLLFKINNHYCQLDRQIQDQNFEQNYQKLEKQVQKYEQEIRNHISYEQQLKLYAESLQAQVKTDSLDKVVLQKQSEIDQLKTQCSDLEKTIQHLKSQVDTQKQKINSQEKVIQTYQQKDTSQKELIDNFNQLNNVINQQQVKQKIQNVKNFQNINIYNLNKDKQKLIEEAINFKYKQQQSSQQNNQQMKQQSKVSQFKQLNSQQQSAQQFYQQPQKQKQIPVKQLYQIQTNHNKIDKLLEKQPISEQKKRTKSTKSLDFRGNKRPEVVNSEELDENIKSKENNFTNSIFKQLQSISDESKKELIVNLLHKKKGKNITKKQNKSNRNY